MGDSFPLTERNRVRRRSQRGRYDHETVYSILDEGLIDDEADHALPHWAGVVPLSLRPARPLPAADLRAEIEIPAYLRDLA